MRERPALTELFHIVANLLPPEQQLAAVAHDTPVRKALVLMERNGYSQLPVFVWDEVIGVFSYRSFSKKAVRLALQHDETLGELPVRDFIEDLEFVHPDDDWDSILHVIRRDDGVLVGNRRNLKGILTPMDAVEYLRDLTRPFVLVSEIELLLRQVVNTCTDENSLAACIQNSLNSVYDSETRPTHAGEFTFNDYVQVIGDGRNWDHFVPFFNAGQGPRKRTRVRLERIRDLRNDIFHFKREIVDEDLRFLSEQRDWLRRNARIFENEKRAVNAGQDIL